MTKIIKIGRMIYKTLESDNILVSVNIDTKVYNLILFSTKKKISYQDMKRWRKLKSILLSERSQSEKATYSVITTI